MKQLNVKGHIDREKEHIDFSLDIYLFKDKGLVYTYCPALDITGYGSTQKDAKDEIEYLLHEYFDYTLKEKTLTDDLSSHGWKTDGKMTRDELRAILPKRLSKAGQWLLKNHGNRDFYISDMKAVLK